MTANVSSVSTRILRRFSVSLNSALGLWNSAWATVGSPLELSHDVLQRPCQNRGIRTHPSWYVPARASASENARLGLARTAGAMLCRIGRCCIKTTAQRPSGRRRFWAGIVGFMFSVAPTSVARPPETDAIDSLPPAGETIEAFRAIDGWVRAWSVPPTVQKIDPKGATGACVTLRLSGEVLGRGSATGEEGNTLWLAARQAWLEADSALPVARESPTRDAQIADLAQRFTVDLQVSGLMTPLLGDTEAAAAGALSMGVFGVAARVGNRTEAFFPGTMLATGATPPEGVRIVLSRLGLPPLGLGELRRQPGVSVYRFPARHLAQTTPSRGPEFLYRGGRIVPLSQTNGPGLRRFAEAVAEHLQTHRWPGEEPFGMTGDFLPIRGAYEPVVAPPLSQAFAAFALARFSRTPGISGAPAIRAARFASDVLHSLARVGADEEDPMGSPAAAAMCLIAADEVRKARETDRDARLLPAEFIEGARSRIRACLGDEGEWKSTAPEETRGLIAFALAVDSNRHGATAGERDVARRAIRSLFRQSDQATLVAEQPWLGWAEILMAENEIPAATALRELRSTVWRFQVDERDAGADSADLAGGIVFTRGRTPLPTWQSLRPLAFVSTALGDRRLTDDSELAAEAAALQRSLRFVLQLGIDEPLTHMFRDSERALGGVRPAVWEQRASVEASALALMTVCETLRSSDARVRKP